ncbi:MAG: PQQ-dependent sugar dehydrogenase [Phenylobacterium sp.]|uniref:PQQ-dependent sugar dehydrogenase n=1 Tax=Phenylobacterium sp. TaxID=1871053 RepID=UPI0012212270|nr:PQQ-dependent sugar dehydrogenase [Phenylobacterium sp.]TAL31880.1 MAG: PQQ-dependent sugar dehydrogenase [Phenylobacterium sp.]
MRRVFKAVSTAAAITSGVLTATSASAQVETRPPITAYKPAFAGQTRAPEQKLGGAFDATTVTSGLQFPWSLAFLPDGRMLVTERRAGKLRVVAKDGTLAEAAVEGTPAVFSGGQGGLLDVVLDPAFKTNGLVYLSYAEPNADGTNNTAVARGKWVDGPTPRLDGLTVIYRQRPALASPLHFGSRLVFARDGKLFVTQGERSIPAGQKQAQDLASGLGKIVRINPDGSIPKDNPFVGKDGARPEIFSYGNRNVQAAALHPQTGELWEVEFGPQSGDEINIIRKGRDYGWPTITYGVNYGPAKTPITGGETQRPGMEQPLYYWDPTIAPSGMIFYTGSLFPKWKGSLLIAGKQPQGLPGGFVTRLTLKGEKVVGEERLETPAPANWRDIRQGPDGAVYLLKDGTAGAIVKLTPKKG